MKQESFAFRRGSFNEHRRQLVGPNGEEAEPSTQALVGSHPESQNDAGLPDELMHGSLLKIFSQRLGKMQDQRRYSLLKGLGLCRELVARLHDR